LSSRTMQRSPHPKVPTSLHRSPGFNNQLHVFFSHPDPAG
jgi:hypothetical protein